MPRETIVDLPCRVKHDLAPGDLRAGSRALVNLVRARERIDAVRARPRQDGRPVQDVAVQVPRLTATGLELETATIGELESRTANLDRHGTVCTNCPANALRRPFGCIGGLPFPVSRAVEQYAMERLAPPDRLGGALFLQTLADGMIDGALTRDYRADSKFEAMSMPARKLPENAFAKTNLTSDELFEPLLRCQGKLEPWMALNVLLWYEAIMFDEKQPASANDVLTLTRMAVPERPKRTKSVLGSPAKFAEAEAFRGLLKLLYVGWSRDVDITLAS